MWIKREMWKGLIARIEKLEQDAARVRDTADYMDLPLVNSDGVPGWVLSGPHFQEFYVNNPQIVWSIEKPTKPIGLVPYLDFVRARERVRVTRIINKLFPDLKAVAHNYEPRFVEIIGEPNHE